MFCPGCGEKVVFRNCRKKIKHFAHLPHSTCDYGKGESNEHLEVKEYLYKLCRKNGIEAYPECTKWEGIRPDVAAKIGRIWVGKKKKKSRIDVWDMQVRMDKNRHNGLYNMWILTRGKYEKIKQCESFVLSDQDYYLRNIYYGILYAFDGERIHAIKTKRDGKNLTIVADGIINILKECECRDKEAYTSKSGVYYPPLKLFALGYNQGEWSW